MTARTVTGTTVLPSGSAQASQTVTFIKRATTISGVTATQSSPPITAATDASGNFSASLDCPADGSTAWTIVYPDGSEFDFTLPYGDGSSVAVTTLISAPTVDADAVTLLLDGYEPTLGNPGTSGHVLSSTTAGVRSWVAQSGGGAVDSVFGRQGAVVAESGDYAASEVSDDSGEAQANVRDALNSLRGDVNTTYDYIDTHQSATTNVHGIADTSLLLDTSDLGVSVQAYSAKTAAIAALTWAANSIILLTGTATAAAQSLAAHIVTFIQSASAADARTAIGAGTGNGDLLAANNLSELTATASTARTNLGLGTLATQAGTFSGGGTLATGGFTLTVPATGTAALRAAANTFTLGQTISTGGGLTPLALVATNSTTSSVLLSMQVNNTISGTPAAGFGQSVEFTLKSSTTYGSIVARLVNQWETATHASRVPDSIFYMTDSAAEREIWRGRANGSAAAIGFLGATPVARQAHIADASGDDAATVNAILDVLEAFGLVATS